jgi:hypothetical protein
MNSNSSSVLPNFSIAEPRNFKYEKFSGYDILDDNFTIAEGVKYDINRVSSRNAKKSELGPYKNSFLRQIITSHGMGKASGTKQDLVSTILSHHEAKSR